MIIFLLILFSIPVFNIYLALWTRKNLKTHPLLSRVLIAFLLSQLLLFFVFIFFRHSHPFPKAVVALFYIWSIVVLTISIVCLFTGQSLFFLFSRLIPRSRVEDISPNPLAPTRRQFILAASALIPPAATVSCAAVGLSQYSRFRVRRMELPIASLPPGLDGLTIAHLSDLHIGNFVDSRVINKVVESTNQLRPDIVCFTGDLIDSAISDLPAGLDMFRKLDPRVGLFLCEGNHDLFQSRDQFIRQTKNAGFNLLSNESLTMRAKNHWIQFLGIAWGPIHTPQQTAVEHHSHETLRQLNPEAFQILLAHHPHAFDYAIEKNVPLTLAGHTHGGQLMLTQNLGPGPLMYKYYSGHYQRKNSSLVVSNGVGNWFPLRVNAPAEIIHITLRTARVS